MPQNLLACFDRDHNPIAPLPINIALSQPYPCYHAVAKLWILNQNAEILCSQRAYYLDNGGKWQTFLRGYVSAGLSTDQAITKIAKDKIGISIDPEKLVSIGEGRSDSHAHFYSNYGLLWDHSYSINFSDKEIIEMKWLSFEKYANLVLNFSNLWCNDISKEDYEALVIMLRLN